MFKNSYSSNSGEGAALVKNSRLDIEHLEIKALEGNFENLGIKEVPTCKKVQRNTQWFHPNSTALLPERTLSYHRPPKVLSVVFY